MGVVCLDSHSALLMIHNVRPGEAGDGIDDGERGRINIFLPSIGQTGLWWPVT